MKQITNEKKIIVHEIFEKDENGNLCRSMYLPKTGEWLFKFRPWPSSRKSVTQSDNK